MRIVECVPNFSEGRNKETIEAIADAIISVDGVALLDVDSGASTNRTVFTFAGIPASVERAAFEAIKTGARLIDMRGHRGEHPRQGACDVCPFVPLAEATMEECVAMAKRVGKRVGEELGIPVYLYAEAAAGPERVRLPDVRRGEYEALEKKIAQPGWRPDFGPASFNAKSGATAIGARTLLVAYNITLNSMDARLAKEIASLIRESGSPGHRPGMFKDVQATGWFISEYRRAQITTNILDVEATPLHAVFDACSELAAQRGAGVTGSEVVGMVPMKALVDAGRHSLATRGTRTDAPESEIIDAAIGYLGLNDVKPFDPDTKILERALRHASLG